MTQKLKVQTNSLWTSSTAGCPKATTQTSFSGKEATTLQAKEEQQSKNRDQLAASLNQPLMNRSPLEPQNLGPQGQNKEQSTQQNGAGTAGP